MSDFSEDIMKRKKLYLEAITETRWFPVLSGVKTLLTVLLYMSVKSLISVYIVLLCIYKMPLYSSSCTLQISFYVAYLLTLTYRLSYTSLPILKLGGFGSPASTQKPCASSRIHCLDGYLPCIPQEEGWEL